MPTRLRHCSSSPKLDCPRRSSGQHRSEEKEVSWRDEVDVEPVTAASILLLKNRQQVVENWTQAVPRPDMPFHAIGFQMRSGQWVGSGPKGTSQDRAFRTQSDRNCTQHSAKGGSPGAHAHGGVHRLDEGVCSPPTAQNHDSWLFPFCPQSCQDLSSAPEKNGPNIWT